MLAKADALKAEGNELYKERKLDKVWEKYWAAVDAAPPSAPQASIYFANLAAVDLKDKKPADAVHHCSSALDLDPTYMKAIMPAGAVHHCSSALELDPTYVKAIMRRITAYEELDDLDKALADAQRVVELDQDNKWAKGVIARLEPLVAERHEKLKDEMLGKLKDLGNTILARLEPLVEERHEKLKDEMLGKLKDLGNTILGKFGMSLDNFKADKDPTSGGYSVRFEQ
eukprot:gene19061-25665_t